MIWLADSMREKSMEGFKEKYQNMEKIALQGLKKYSFAFSNQPPCQNY
jgi:hypothetical protein